MSWLEDNAGTATDTKVDDRWLKIPDPPIGKNAEVKIRILDEEPVGIWRHWQGGKSFNCPGIATCPVCKVRMEAKKKDPEGFRNVYRMDYRYYFNVLVDGQVKIFSFSSTVGRKLKTFLEKYGDLRDYDVTIQKHKTGHLPMNVDYDVLYEGKSALSEEDAAKSEDRYDLSQYTQPASREVLEVVAAGHLPTAESKPEDSISTVATTADMIMLKALLKEKNPPFELSDFGIKESTPPTKKVVEALIRDLTQSK